ncbi:MAG: ABC transporter permease [Rhizobiaceae bacterium]|nr:ABC transporter permease [Rhizobiaceae bacterium]
MMKPGTGSGTSAAKSQRSGIAAIVSRFGIVLVLVALVVVLSMMSSAFLTPRNLLNVLAQVAPAGIVACGAALVIIAGGFDLSAGAIFAISGIVAAYLANTTAAVVAIAAGASAGLLLGVVNGGVITLFGINSFIATLATGFIFRGVATMITGGFLIGVNNPTFSALGNMRVFTVPIPVYVFAGVAIVTGLLLSQTKLGRYVYATGGNAEAARLSGVRVDLVRVATYAISGLCAGIGGVIFASRVSTGQADAGTGLELTVIAAVVVGGISIKGGEGSIWRAVVGVLLIALIGNGFNILNINPFYQSIAQGLIILVAVAVDSRSGGLAHQYLRRLRRGGVK